MSNAQVAANWRLQTGRSKKGSSMYYEGRTIYSYGPHFPMAYITDYVYKGDSVILMNADRYSNSTAKHLNHMRSVCYGEAVVRLSTELLKRMIDAIENAPDMSTMKRDCYIELEKRVLDAMGRKNRSRKYKAVLQTEIDGYQEQQEIIESL